MLHVAQMLGVCVFAHGEAEMPRLESWPRAKAERAIAEHGAMLAGPNAREANFGLCSIICAQTYVFFETAHS